MPWILISVFLLGILFIYPRYKMVFAPSVSMEEGEEIEFFIEPGMDYTDVGKKLMELRLIADPEGFHWVAERMNYPNHVYPGRYKLQNGMSNRELVGLLRSGTREPIRYTFVKFRTPEEAAEHASQHFSFGKSEMLQVLNDAEFLKQYSDLTPETALTVFIPNTYEIYWHISPQDFFARMHREYKNFWDRNDRNEKRNKWGLNRLEVMTLASIIEEESNKNDEKPRIAGVYLNRIRNKWPLEADPTVKFAMKDFALKRILNSHLEYDSPYNTYKYPGIPPGPICTPSIPSIDAVLDAERHKYMFFCARADTSGYHHFSETLSEHNAYAATYHEFLNRIGIR
jgi:UPF0755 protein